MKMKEIIDDRLLEQLQYGDIPDINVGFTKLAARRPSKVLQSTKTGASKTYTVINKTFSKTIDSLNHGIGPNAETDITKGPNFKLDNYNIRPEITDIDLKIYNADAI
jgi:hypothetical protein